MRCPNCGHDVSADDKLCPSCEFNLEKFRNDFFTDRGNNGRSANSAQEKQKTNSYNIKNTNATVSVMIQWIRANVTIVFLLGVFLLILMSFSRTLGWFSFLALMIILFVVCDRNPNVEQYTADKNLTDKVNQAGSDVMNSFEKTQAKVDKRRKNHNKQPINQEVAQVVKQKRTATQLGTALMALISLIVIFFGPFSSSSMLNYQEISISKTLLNLGGLGKHYSLIGYGLWFVLITIPIAIIILTIRNKKNNKQFVFILSLIETVLLVIIGFQLIFLNAGSTVGITNTTASANRKVQRAIANAISFGVSSYLLLISSILTTFIGYKSIKNNNTKSSED